MGVRRGEFKIGSHVGSPGSNRIQEVDGRWFYATREGSIEGPFGNREAAQQSLEGYIQFASCRLVDRESLQRINSMSLAPI